MDGSRQSGGLIKGRNVRFVRIFHPTTLEVGYLATIGQMPSLRGDGNIKPTAYARTDPGWYSYAGQDVGDEHVQDVDEDLILRLFGEAAANRAVQTVLLGGFSAYLGNRKD